FRVPSRDELAERLDAVLQAIYAAFTEGWADPAGADATRRDLAEEALFLARLVAELLPSEAEALGLLALILHAEARRKARRDASGDFVPLAGQDRAQWDWNRIEEAECTLRQASALGAVGRFQLEAAIQSVHVARCHTGRASWAELILLYDGLIELTGSPVAMLNRTLAIAEVEGAKAGLSELERLAASGRLNEYQPFWAARAELLMRAGRGAEAQAAYELAIGLESDPAVRRFLQKKQDSAGRLAV
ncbi:MAG TPA: DUF6596 domain-containing protein, partial [Pirellulaceae bacterium]|nr:DUF6596 domain-containing protein [Pirellulaceae bacterium]